MHTSALLTASDDRAWFATDVRGGSDTSTLALDGAPITRIRKQNDNGLILINDDTAELVMRDFFGTAATRSEWTVYIQTRTGVAFTDNIQGAGTNYVRMEFTDPLHQEIINTIRTGTPFIFAVAKTAVLLQLADFDETDLNVDAKALLEAKDDTLWYVAPNRFRRGVAGTDTPIAGELGLGVGQTVIDRIARLGSDSDIVILNDTDVPVELNLRDYFGVEAGLQRDAGWTLYIQTKQGVASTNTVFNSGSGFVNMQFEDNVEILDSISNGTRFIAAIARPIVFEFATETFPITGNIFEAVAIALPRIPDEPVGTTYTLSNPPSGLTFSAADHNLTGTFDPSLANTGGTSVLTATQGTRTATVNVNWSVSHVEGFDSASEDTHWNTSTAVDYEVFEINDNTGSVTVDYAVTGLPAGLTFDAATLFITGTPTASGDGTAVVTASIGGTAIATFDLNWDVTTQIQYQVYAATLGSLGVGLESVDIADASTTLIPGVIGTYGSSIVERDGELYAMAFNQMWRMNRTNVTQSPIFARFDPRLPSPAFSAFVQEDVIYSLARSRYYTIAFGDVENGRVAAVDSGRNPTGQNIVAATDHLGKYYWIDSSQHLYCAKDIHSLSGARQIGRVPFSVRNSRVGITSADKILYMSGSGKLWRMTDVNDISTIEEVGSLRSDTNYIGLATIKTTPSAADVVFEIEELSFELNTSTAPDPIFMPRAVGSQTGITYYARGLPAGMEFGTSGDHAIQGTPTSPGMVTANFWAQKGDQRTNVTLNFDIALILLFDDSEFDSYIEGAVGTASHIDMPRVGPFDLTSPTGVGPEPRGVVYSTRGDLPDGIIYNSALHRLEGTPAPDTAERVIEFDLIATVGAFDTSLPIQWYTRPLNYGGA